MKLIGHVSTAVLAAAPVIAWRHSIPGVGDTGLSDFQLLWWTGLWAAAPDLDILLSRFTPIKHRGFASHSLFTVVLAGALLLGGWWWLSSHPVVVAPRPEALPVLVALTAWLHPLTAALAMLAIAVHLLGDSLTKTGIPLFWPGKDWHFPLVGGYAAFDNYFLNAIPLAAACYMVVTVFQYDPGVLRHFGHWRDLVAMR